MGSIPARAGEPAWAAGGPQVFGVYPRACGGTTLRNGLTNELLGLSPRVRGNRRDSGAWLGAKGSIPARAGEPDVIAREQPLDRVYPRACGGTSGAATLFGL